MGARIAIAALTLLPLAWPTPAAAASPDEATRAAFARAMGVPLDAVWRVDAVPAPAGAAHASAVFGRYEEAGQPRAGLTLLRRCPTGRCEGPRHGLGKASEIRVLAVVDLLGEPRPLPLDDTAWPLQRVAPPTGAARWPALVVQTREKGGGGALVEALRVIDLKEAAGATLAQLRTQQWQRGGFRTRTAELVTGVAGAPLDLVLTQLVQRGVCRTPDCIPPRPTEQLVRYRLDRRKQRFVALGAPETPPPPPQPRRPPKPKKR